MSVLHRCFRSVGASPRTGLYRALYHVSTAVGAGSRPAADLRYETCVACSSNMSAPPGIAAGETVTATVLSTARSISCSGLPPAGLAAFATAISEDPTCMRCTIAPITGDQADQLSDFLLGFGAQSVVVEEDLQPGEKEQQIFGVSDQLWDKCRIIAYFELEHDIDGTLTLAQEALDFTLDSSYSLEPVVNTEWVEQIKASYIPLRITDQLYIIPSWSEPEDSNAVNIILEPGVAFGTGEHPTTRLCLQQLMELGQASQQQQQQQAGGQQQQEGQQQQQQPSGLTGWRVMDYGAGSGVLAITSLKLGASSAVGTDTDPLAVKAAKRNAEMNGFGDAFQVLRCSPSLSDPDPLLQLAPSTGSQPSVADEQFDLVMANILRGPLLELQPRLSSYCRPGGRLLLSGVLAEQVPDILAAYEADFKDFVIKQEGSWAMVTAVKHN